MKKIYYTSNLVLSFIVMLCSCKKYDISNTTEPKKSDSITQVQEKTIIYDTISYKITNTKEWLKINGADSNKLDIVCALNRTDKTHFKKLVSVVVPSDFSRDLVYYLPFPLRVSALEDVSKIIIFSYPTQTFAVYVKGKLVYTGPTNMGRKSNKTPTGLFFTNWKSKQSISTVNAEWVLKWNFNIENKLGIGFHEYALPGYPASHSCLRLLEKDAKYLYNFADQWILKDKQNIKVKGTPVIVFGKYDFDGPKPWLKLASDPKALNISETEIENEIKPYIQKILENQKILK